MNKWNPATSLWGKQLQSTRDEGRPWVLCQNECMQVDGKGRNVKTSRGNSSLPPHLEQDNPSNPEHGLCPFGSLRAHCFGEAIPACFVISWPATQLWSTKQHKMVQAQTSGATHLLLLQPLQKHRGWVGRWKICLWGEIGQISESNNWETDAVFLPHHTGILLKHTLINWRFSSVKAIPCTLQETILPSRLRSVARSLMYKPLARYMTSTLSWEARSGRLQIKTLLETHLLHFLTFAREQFSKVSFYMLLIKHEKNREIVLYFHAVSLFTGTH